MRAARILFASSCLAALITLPTSAVAGSVFNITIDNQSPSDVTIKTFVSRNWYPRDFRQPQNLPAKTKHTYSTEECSNVIGCITASDIVLHITTTSTGAPDVALTLKGVLGPDPSLNKVISKTITLPSFGQVGAVNYPRGAANVLFTSLECGAPANNAVSCTLTLTPGIFETLLEKYQATTKEMSARNYYSETKVLQTDGVVFNSQYRANAVVDFDGTTMSYRNPGFANLTLDRPDCSEGQEASYLYVFTLDREVLVLPVCDERDIPKLPLLYENNHIRPIDNGRDANQTLSQGRLPITHAGLAGAADVRAAGVMVLDDRNRLVSINNDSGHYQPSCAALSAAVFDMLSRGDAPFTDPLPIKTEGQPCSFKAASTTKSQAPQRPLPPRAEDAAFPRHFATFP